MVRDGTLVLGAWEAADGSTSSVDANGWLFRYRHVAALWQVRTVKHLRVPLYVRCVPTVNVLVKCTAAQEH